MDNFENGKDKLVGRLKEAAGKFTDSEELEFKGKLQYMKSGVGEKLGDVKDEVLEKTNDIIDKMKGNQRG